MKNSCERSEQCWVDTPTVEAGLNRGFLQVIHTKTLLYYSFHCEHSVGYYCGMPAHTHTHARARTHMRTDTHTLPFPPPNRTPEEELKGVGRSSSQLDPGFPRSPPSPSSSATLKAAISTTLTSASSSLISLIWR